MANGPRPTPQKPKELRTSVLVVIIVVSLFAGGLLGYFIGYSAISEEIDNLQDQVTTLQEQISSLESKQDNTEVDNLKDQLSIIQEQLSNLQTTSTVTYQNLTYVLDEIGDLEDQLLILQQQINNLPTTPPVTYQNITYILYENVSLSQLFDQVRESVVVVQAIITQYDFFGRPYYTQVQGSGFVYSINGQMVILTNYHM